MDKFDLTTVFGIFSALWRLVGGVLRLDPRTFIVALETPGIWKPALGILFLGGLSDMIGQSVVLFANRVSPRRFLVSLLMGGAMLVISVFFWGVSVWAMASFVFDANRPFRDVLIVIALSYAPLLFGFLILLPYLGNIIQKLLRVWIFLALLIGVAVAFDFTFWPTLLTTILGWISYELIARIPFLRIKALDNWLWQLATGTDRLRGTDELVDQVVQEARAASAIQRNGEQE